MPPKKLKQGAKSTVQQVVGVVDGNKEDKHPRPNSLTWVNGLLFHLKPKSLDQTWVGLILTPKFHTEEAGSMSTPKSSIGLGELAQDLATLHLLLGRVHLARVCLSRLRRLRLIVFFLLFFFVGLSGLFLRCLCFCCLHTWGCK